MEKISVTCVSHDTFKLTLRSTMFALYFHEKHFKVLLFLICNKSLEKTAMVESTLKWWQYHVKSWSLLLGELDGSANLSSHSSMLQHPFVLFLDNLRISQVLVQGLHLYVEQSKSLLRFLMCNNTRYGLSKQNQESLTLRRLDYMDSIYGQATKKPDHNSQLSDIRNNTTCRKAFNPQYLKAM